MAAATPDVIVVDRLRKRYGDRVAVEDVSFSVRQGEIFGIIGPNGAGKTTTVESLIGLRQRDGGNVSVLGEDPAHSGASLRSRLGVQLQEAQLPDRMTVGDAIGLYGALYERTVPWQPLLERWGLTGQERSAFGKLSGGQKQRLFVVLALLNDPDLVVLDELSAGLDPQARRASWQLIRDIRDSGKTVVLVSHFMDEAEALCDRIAVIDRGRVVALDSPAALSKGLEREPRVLFTAPDGFQPDRLAGRSGVARIERTGDQVRVAGGRFVMADVAAALKELDCAPADLRMDTASLEDVFIRLTTHDMGGAATGTGDGA